MIYAQAEITMVFRHKETIIHAVFYSMQTMSTI